MGADKSGAQEAPLAAQRRNLRNCRKDRHPSALDRAKHRFDHAQREEQDRRAPVEPADGRARLLQMFAGQFGEGENGLQMALVGRLADK